MNELLVNAFVGIASACVVACLLSLVPKWRENEQARNANHCLLRLFRTEVKRRLNILNDNYAGKDFGEYGNAIKSINLTSSGVTFNYINELKPYQRIFDTFADRLLCFNPQISAAISEHYLFMEESLLAHQRFLHPPSINHERANEILINIRLLTNNLLDAIDQEQKNLDSRNFFKWLLLWVIGKS